MNTPVKTALNSKDDVEVAYYASQIEQARIAWGWTVEEAIAHQNAQEVTRQPTTITAQPSLFESPTAIQASIFDVPEDPAADVVPNSARYVEGLKLLERMDLITTDRRNKVPKHTPTVCHGGKWYYLAS